VASPPPPVDPGPASRDHIEALVRQQPVVLFMKGHRVAPQCGFSAKAVAVLDALQVEYATVDVLADPAVRAGIKEYGQWPTIPQLYVHGDLLGGSDIVEQMYEAGELHELLGLSSPAPAVEVPQVHETAPEQVRDWLQAAEALVFLDVRTPEERALATIEGSELLTRDRLAELEQLPRDTRVVFVCHHGIRSRQAAEAFRTLGFTDLHNLQGGIEAWSTRIDLAVPRY
jgi:Grx4 family monothiol glutaredoxin